MKGLFVYMYGCVFVWVPSVVYLCVSLNACVCWLCGGEGGANIGYFPTAQGAVLSCYGPVHFNELKDIWCNTFTFYRSISVYLCIVIKIILNNFLSWCSMIYILNIFCVLYDLILIWLSIFVLNYNSFRMF